MAEPISELQLRWDQVFGLHLCVPDADVESVCRELDRALIEFSRDWKGADRLNLPGCTTILLHDAEDFDDAKALFPDERLRVATEVVRLPARYDEPLAPLLEMGQPDSEARQPEDYRLRGIESVHVPQLVAMAVDPELHTASSESTTVWAPIHAIRALGQFRAESAIAPLIELLRARAKGDDWLPGEISTALARIGPASFAPLAARLADEAESESARLVAARALAILAVEHPEARTEAIGALVQQLNAHLVQMPEFNGFLVSALLDAQAKETVTEIEQAFASGRVDEFIAGDFEDVQVELGLKPRRERPPMPNKWTKMGAELRGAFGMPDPVAEDEFADAGPLQPAVPEPYRAPPKVGRNDPCPCGSGKKFKKCCGA